MLSNFHWTKVGTESERERDREGENYFWYTLQQLTIIFGHVINVPPQTVDWTTIILLCLNHFNL